MRRVGAGAGCRSGLVGPGFSSPSRLESASDIADYWTQGFGGSDTSRDLAVEAEAVAQDPQSKRSRHGIRCLRHGFATIIVDTGAYLRRKLRLDPPARS